MVLTRNISITYPTNDTENIHSEYLTWQYEMEKKTKNAKN